MADLANGFEGQTNGTTATPANSAASGDAFATIFSNGAVANSALVYSTAAAVYGTMGCRITLAAGASYARFDESVGTGRRVMTRTVKIPSSGAPTAEFVLMRADAGGTLMADIRVISTGVFRVAPQGASMSASASPAVSANGTYLLQYAVTPGTTTSNGRVEYRVINPSNGSVIHTYDSGTTVNTGTANQTRARFGGEITGKGWTVDDLDAVGFYTMASGWPALPTSNATPSANAGADQTVEAGATVTLPLVGTDSDGTITTYSVTQTSGTTVTLSGTGNSRTFKAPIPLSQTTLTFSLTVTDNAGATSPADTVVITVLAAPLRMKTASGIKGAIRRMKMP